MLLTVLGTAVGLTMLTIAADHLVVGAGRVAARLRVAPIIVGVVVIGFGTSVPELFVSGLAASQGDVGLAVGNLIGSNMLNLTLVLGVAALIRPIAVASSAVRREAPLMLAAMALFSIAAAIRLGAIAGLILAAATMAALVILIRLVRAGPDSALPPEVMEFIGDDSPRHRLSRELPRTLVGTAGVVAGAQLLVVNAAQFAATIGIPQVVIGFTLVAIGTSLPELVTGIQAQRHGESDLLVGNVLGSNMFNSLAGGAVVGLAAGRPGTAVAWHLLAAMLLVGLLAWALLFRGYQLTGVEGLLLLATYVLSLPLLL